MNTDLARMHMIEQQVRPWRVSDKHVIAQMSQVPREKFVPAGYEVQAFADLEIPLRANAEASQWMLAPCVQARLVQELALKPSDRVLEIGTGSGYVTALIAGIAASVLSLEIDPELAATAKTHLKDAGVANAEVRVGDGAAPLGTDSGFDAILLNGSVGRIPDALLQRLNAGGRLVAIVGDEPMMRVTCVTRQADQSFETASHWDTVAPRLKNFAPTRRFSL